MTTEEWNEVHPIVTDEQKNIAIAEMLGAVKENWYPPNKDNETTGDYYIFPHTLYEYIEEGKTKQYRWYPDNVRQHGDSKLKFHSDANWQYEAIDWVEAQGYRVQSYTYGCYIVNVDEQVITYDGDNRKEAIFEALYQFSQYLKEKK